MDINKEKIPWMSDKVLMEFVKECCVGDEEVTRKISAYTACRLKWIHEIDGFVMFTVLAGMFEGGRLCNAHEYITVSFDTETERLYCLSNYLHNYGGYEIYISSADNCIKQKIGHGWGSWEYKDLGYDLSVKAVSSKQDHGCCCG